MRFAIIMVLAGAALLLCPAHTSAQTVNGSPTVSRAASTPFDPASLSRAVDATMRAAQRADQQDYLQSARKLRSWGRNLMIIGGGCFGAAFIGAAIDPDGESVAGAAVKIFGVLGGFGSLGAGIPLYIIGRARMNLAQADANLAPAIQLADHHSVVFAAGKKTTIAYRLSW